MILLTPKTTLVPEELFRPEEAAHYLELAGLRCSSEECAVWSAPCRGAVAVMAINRLTARQPAPEGYTSPLLQGPEAVSQPTLWMARHQSLIYIKVYDPALQLAEVLTAECDEDILFYIASLQELFSTRTFQLQVEGEGSSPLRKLLKPYFK